LWAILNDTRFNNGLTTHVTQKLAECFNTRPRC
jgi:hypothetical protein